MKQSEEVLVMDEEINPDLPSENIPNGFKPVNGRYPDSFMHWGKNLVVLKENKMYLDILNYILSKTQKNEPLTNKDAKNIYDLTINNRGGYPLSEMMDILKFLIEGKK